MTSRDNASTDSPLYIPAHERHKFRFFFEHACYVTFRRRCRLKERNIYGHFNQNILWSSIEQEHVHIQHIHTECAD